MYLDEKNMKNIKKVLINLIVISIIVTTSFIGNSQKIYLEKIDLENSSDDVELYLLRVEHYLDLFVKEDTDVINVLYACPPIYGYQVPIFVEVFDDSTAEIINYKIEDDIDCPPNKFVNFTINSMKKNQHKLIHFTIWVLVEKHNFSDIPDNKPFPEDPSDLPVETRTWLGKTEVTQKNRILIKIRSRIIKRFNNDVISYAKYVSNFIKKHRYFLFLLQLNLRIFFSQDALTTLLINGENVGRSHLACALMRNQNIPSRVILVNNDQGFWTQMHYMVEYYVPDYGWVLLDTTKGETPYNTSRQIINRICYPSDENDTKTDYIFRLMKGEERWIWFSDENVKPYYVDCDEGSKSQMFTEKSITTCEHISVTCFHSTIKTFNKFQSYLGESLTGQNLEFFENAINFQKQALNSFQNNDIMNYYYYLERSFEEYDKITF
jgi:hypothetical protein